MPLLTKFTQLAEQMETGGCPPAFSDRNAAFTGLVDAICGAPWRTPAEREKAQGLLARLERLRWAEQGTGLSPPSRGTA
jgi:hypothetical protein